MGATIFLQSDPLHFTPEFWSVLIRAAVVDDQMIIVNRYSQLLRTKGIWLETIK